MNARLVLAWSGIFTSSDSGSPNTGSVSLTLLAIPEASEIALLVLGLGFTAFRFRTHQKNRMP